MVMISQWVKIFAQNYILTVMFIEFEGMVTEGEWGK